VIQRQTKYTEAVSRAVDTLGHASNQDILTFLRRENMKVSSTTVHRVSRRLCDSGVIACAPQSSDGSMRYDSTTATHDHFVCRFCDAIADITVSSRAREEFSAQLNGCHIDGQLIVYGSCKNCFKNKEG